MTALLLFGISVVFSFLTKEGLRIWIMCLCIAAFVHECGTYEKEQRGTHSLVQNGREMYTRGLQICQNAHFQDVVVLKHYFPANEHVDFSYYCVDSEGGLHVAPKVSPQPQQAPVPQKDLAEPLSGAPSASDSAQ